MERIERHTDRLRLRPVAEADLDVFHALEVSLRTREDPPRPAPSREDSAHYLSRFVRTWERGDLGYWTISHGDHIVGFGGVQPKRWRERLCWNLYYRVHPDWWGLGIATETAREAIAAGTALRPDWPVLVETDPSNIPAIRVAERAGLTRQEPRQGDEYTALLLDGPR